jgi:hypothetical protein
VCGIRVVEIAPIELLDGERGNGLQAEFGEPFDFRCFQHIGYLN